VEALEDEVEILQATIDEESGKARLELDRAHQECDQLKQQLASRPEPRPSSTPSRETARLKSQLADATGKVTKLTDERRQLQERSASLDTELRSVRASLEETKAERNELEAEIGRLNEQGEDTFKLDHERVDLRVTKTKLEAELRRLKEENKALSERRREVENSLENEIEKAAAEEDRLGDEIRDLQAKLRQSSDNHELPALRRTIRELERRVEEYETQLATSQFPQGGEGNSELSLLHRELSAARKKEIDQIQHEASQKDTIKSLKRQIADLERKAHEAALDRYGSSPSSNRGSAQKAEVSELRHQLSTANQSVHDLKKSLREAERKASSSARELQKCLDEFEDEKFVLEQALEDAHTAAEDSAAAHEETLKKYKQKLDKYKRERDELATAVRDQQSNSMNSSEMPLEERRDLHKMLRESQLAADRLDRELREHREALEELMGVESSLRKKLERARSERAAYRTSAEKLHKDFRKLKVEKDKAVAEATSAAAAANEERALVRASKPGKNGVDTDAIIRAAEAAEKRHEKEIRGMVMQMEWLKACWDREAKLRSDAAYAKQYLMMQVQVRDAWYVFRLFIFSPSQSLTSSTATKPTWQSSTASARASSPRPGPKPAASAITTKSATAANPNSATRPAKTNSNPKPNPNPKSPPLPTHHHRNHNCQPNPNQKPPTQTGASPSTRSAA
jgi:chromosome segregation ATPase